ncbi:BQ5605_C003g02146 [Microbotryum silenes-dioicae]|uniref:BQ5605_C003g02146 protein n=1 Tax=Microbotryum silenes-dioicae TaxID=796604 RepID=A0A2X0NY59_9BASI|nr:BQ5605_C003g02146 [Microbotryum silenes-dioicae]
MTIGARQVNIQLGVRTLDRGGDDPPRTCRRGCDLACHLPHIRQGNYIRPMQFNKRFAGGPVPPSASLDGGDNRTQITFL